MLILDKISMGQPAGSKKFNNTYFVFHCAGTMALVLMKVSTGRQNMTCSNTRPSFDIHQYFTAVKKVNFQMKKKIHLSYFCSKH